MTAVCPSFSRYVSGTKQNRDRGASKQQTSHPPTNQSEVILSAASRIAAYPPVHIPKSRGFWSLWTYLNQSFSTLLLFRVTYCIATRSLSCTHLWYCTYLQDPHLLETFRSPQSEIGYRFLGSRWLTAWFVRLIKWLQLATPLLPVRAHRKSSPPGRALANWPCGLYNSNWLTMLYW